MTFTRTTNVSEIDGIDYKITSVYEFLIYK